MTVQTTYPRDFSEAFAGLLGDIRPNTIESFSAEGEVKFGLGVVDGTDPLTQVKIIDVVGDVFRGISVHQHNEQTTAGAQDASYKDEDTVSVLRKGTVWMIQEPTVSAPSIDDAAFINVAVAAQKGTVTEVSTANRATGGFFRNNIR